MSLYSCDRQKFQITVKSMAGWDDREKLTVNQQAELFENESRCSLLLMVKQCLHSNRASQRTNSYLQPLVEETSDGFKLSRCWAADFPKQKFTLLVKN